MNKYYQIYEDLKTKIINNEYQQQLPSESQLTEKYGVSRNTIRRAIDSLISDGLVVSKKGKGVFVLENRSFEFAINGLESFQEVMVRTKENFQTDVALFEHMIADEQLANKSGFAPNTVLTHIKRVRSLQNERIILDVNYFARELIPGLTPEIAQKSIYTFIEKELAIEIGIAKKNIVIERATADDYEHLDMLDFDLVAVVHNFVYLQNGVLFEYTQSRHRPDRFVFTDIARR
ncbi:MULTISPECIES: trehalose operon repressor [Listeria]|uniref:trehalose operon repressor n=1 Tax=Listeria TaxID=1637 RepID=UPI000B593582|nr:MULTISPECIES: trehalose operon repressor [Listeria]